MNDSISISVRHLVEFILRSGDIDRRHSASSAEAMQMGSMIHRKLQEEQSTEDYDYRAEVPLKFIHEADEYELVIEGRADGIITLDNQVIIDEIKSVYGDVKHLEEPKEVHLAQAKVYAAIVAEQRALREVGVRMTYCSIDSMEIKYFHYSYTIGEITQFLKELINAYHKWAVFIVQWKKLRNASASELEFPYPYREGQKELAANVYRTIYHRKRLFLMAPTGVGKTLCVTFPAVKAIGEGRTDKIFYLTGKTVTGQAAVEAFDAMASKGLKIKTVVIAGREKVCLNEEVKCNPDECPYAKGHFDRVNDVLYNLLTSADIYSREDLSDAALKAGVCPYELALDLATFADAVICDYNYVFDPKAALADYFAPGKDGSELILVDEAHNLVDRARQMYSASLDSARIAAVRKKLRNAVKNGEFPKRIPTRAGTQLGKLVKILDDLSDRHGDFAENVDKDEFILIAGKALALFEDMLDAKELKGLFDDEDILNFYFELNSFVFTAGLYDEESYVNYIERTHENNVRIKLMCVNPSSNLMEYLGKRSAVFFSATLIPVTYYIDLISADRRDYTVYARSTFDNNRCGHFIVEDVSSLYKQRGEQTYNNIARVIKDVCSQREGNYMAFFPSYSFMDEVYSIYEEKFAQDGIAAVKQAKSMSEEARNAFLEEFRNRKSGNLVGFCVLGGVFSEGIDLKEDALIGALVVGTGLPMLTKERELLKKHFDLREMNGFDYAYRFPGIIKVLQAAGRVIRTEKDLGIVVLMDERFTGRGYKGLFPEEWDNITETDSYAIGEEVNGFWASVNEGIPQLRFDEGNIKEKDYVGR